MKYKTIRQIETRQKWLISQIGNLKAKADKYEAEWKRLREELDNMEAE